MRLTELMDGAHASFAPLSGDDPEIAGLASDSRAVRPGYLFAALAGRSADGAAFVGEAVARGAAAILVADAAPFAGLKARLIADPNPRQRLAFIAARFYAPQPATIAAVTGTNGKTSVADFTRQIWRHHGQRAASLGTIGIVGPDFATPGSLTTPDPIVLHRELQTLARAGIDHVALEASSHGLDQFRLDGLTLAAAAFTNLTRDHLDYHADMAGYFAAKRRLFADLLPPGGTAVLNLDSAEGVALAALCGKRGQRVIGFGSADGADLRLLASRPAGNGQLITLAAFGTRRMLTLPLLGAFQGSNALAALGLAVATGTPVATALDALAQLDGVAGPDGAGRDAGQWRAGDRRLRAHARCARNRAQGAAAALRGAAGRGVRLRRRPRSRQAPADGRDRRARRRHAHRHRRQSAHRGCRADPPRHPRRRAGRARDRRPPRRHPRRRGAARARRSFVGRRQGP